MSRKGRQLQITNYTKHVRIWYGLPRHNFCENSKKKHDQKFFWYHQILFNMSPPTLHAAQSTT
jgi:hypothetical protein